MKKKLLCIVLAVAVIFSALGVTASAESSEQQNVSKSSEQYSICQKMHGNEFPCTTSAYTTSNNAEYILTISSLSI